MTETFQELPIVYAIYEPTGELIHVDQAANGKACNCICPDPHCGQRLIARNGGERRIHHFAHERGSCEWSIESLISRLAADTIKTSGFIACPRLTYDNAETCREKTISESRRIRISDVTLKEVSGRQAPDVFVTCRGKHGDRTFAIVFQLNHTVSDEQISRLSTASEGVILIDFRKDMQRLKREEGKHFDRASIAMTYQDKDLIASVLADGDCGFKSWRWNAKAERQHRESLQKREERDAKEAQERKALYEQLIRKRHEEEEQRAEEARRQQEEWEKLQQEAEQTRQREAELAEAMSPEHDPEIAERMRPLLNQHKTPAQDEFGRRWYKCECCGMIGRDDAFTFEYGGDKMNLGVCRKCNREGRLR